MKAKTEIAGKKKLNVKFSRFDALIGIVRLQVLKADCSRKLHYHMRKILNRKGLTKYFLTSR